MAQKDLGHLDSSSYSDAIDAHWLGRWLAVGLLSIPAASPTRDEPMLSVAISGQSPDTSLSTTMDEAISDEMLLREMERIVRHIVHAAPEFDALALAALYSKPEELYI